MTHLYAIRSNWRRQIFAESDRRAIMHNIDDVLARQNEQTSAQQVVDKFTQYISRSSGPGKAEDFVLRRTRGQRVESVHGSSPTTVHGYPPEWEIQISKPWNDTAAGGSHYTGDWHFDQEG